MALRINDTAPDFTADTSDGEIRFHDWLGDSYGIIFSHPKDFTPVCTTEFGAVAQLAPEWEKRKTKVLGVSVDSADEHRKWKRDIEAFAGTPANFAIVDDTDLKVAKLYDMLPADAYMPDGRTANDSATVRTVYIIGPDKKVRLMMTYPMSVGRNFAEILRALDAVQATDGVPIATPADWQPGQDVIAALSLTDEQNPKGLQFEENQPEILVQILDDPAVDLAIINGNYFIQAGMTLEDAVVVEEISGENPYANFVAWREGEKTPGVEKLDELLHSPEVKEYIEQTWPGGDVTPSF